MLGWFRKADTIMILDSDPASPSAGDFWVLYDNPYYILKFRTEAGTTIYRHLNIWEDA